MDIDTHDGLETKAGIPHDAVVTHGEMMRAFEAFKEANDERLDKKDADVVLEEKLARISAAIDGQARRLDDITLKSARPAIGGDKAARSAAALEHKAAFEAYVRAGETAGLRGLEQKALSVGSNPDGGFLVPPEVEIMIGQRLTSISPIRSIAGVRTIGSNVYKKPFMTAGPAVGWVGETDARAQTASPTLDELSFPAMELYAQPAATATLLEELGRQHRRVDRAGSGAGVRPAGGGRFRQRRRLEQAQGLPLVYYDRQQLVELGQYRLRGERSGRRISGL